MSTKVFCDGCGRLLHEHDVNHVDEPWETEWVLAGADESIYKLRVPLVVRIDHDKIEQNLQHLCWGCLAECLRHLTPEPEQLP